MRLMQRQVLLAVAILIIPPLWAGAQDREAKVQLDRQRFANDSRWIYNDLDRGRALARESGKPMLVVFRCVPCEACSEFDKQVIEKENEIDHLLAKYVCVRMIHANAMDLSLFQIDFDQSFHAVLMNADNVIYGRFGTRSRRPEEEDMTMDGFREALARGLEWHGQYPGNAHLFAAKKRPDSSVPTPEQYPSLKDRYTSRLNLTGKIVPSCIHCHQVREAERLVFRTAGEVWPERLLYPFPLPEVVGLRMDPRQCATVADVERASIAARGGLRAGDAIVELGGQPLLSTADLQWVLHTAGDADDLAVKYRRGGEILEGELTLPTGWRTKADISWRATSWDLRRMATGGMLLEELGAERRKELGIEADKLALLAKHVGQFGEHAVAKRAGFEKDDVLIEIDGQRANLRETDLIAYALKRPIGSTIEVKVRRGKREISLSYATQ